MKNELVTEYAEKIFYFCLRKCSNAVEAEDLTQDIMLNIFTSLQATNPDNLPAYVWRIARNRYAKWAATKRKRVDNETDFDTADVSFADAIADNDDMHLLRRELAFISRDYRDIIVAHYIHNQRVNDIAVSLALPRGTVLWRLSRAREKLKEGMKMSRVFGARSYNPEEISFASTGNQSHGLPWSAVDRMTPKNILLAANNNPSTIEALAIELGIAAPYMAEEVALLEDARLIKKVGNKYATNFFIADRTCQEDIWAAQRQNSSHRAKLIWEITKDCLPKLRSMGIAPQTLPDIELSWTTALLICDVLLKNIDGYSIDFPVEHKFAGDTWGFVGYESTDITIGLSHNGAGPMDTILYEYVPDNHKIWNESRLVNDWRLVKFFGDVIRENRKMSALSAAETAMLQPFLDNGIACVENDAIVVRIPIFAGDSMKTFKPLVKEHPAFDELQKAFRQSFDDTVAILRRYANPILAQQMNYCATMFAFALRTLAVDDLVEAGQLALPEDVDKSMAGVYLEM